MSEALNLEALAQLFLYFGTLLLLVRPLGLYIAGIFTDQPAQRLRYLSRIETPIYRLLRVDPAAEMDWRRYAASLLLFSLFGTVLLYVVLLLQGLLPLNPQGFPGLAAHQAFNIATSFVTNSNWQSYSPETSVSHFTQAVGLTVQNFLSPAAGLCVLAALIRGIARRQTTLIGNFWVDCIRGLLYLLLPMSLVVAVALGSQGVVQTFEHEQLVPRLETLHLPEQRDGNGRLIGEKRDIENQALALGPAASQVAIKQVGSNGGGFFNANAAHPFENPTPLSNFLEMLILLLLPAALCYTFGEMVGDRRQGWALVSAMLLIFIPLFLVCFTFEQRGNPALTGLAVDQAAGDHQPGGNMEGKELRHGILNATLWTSATTASSNGSVNAAHDSYTAMGGFIPLLFMMIGEVVFGGIGSGMAGMLVFVLLTVFLTGLMVGRTPEYLGKKIQAYEIKMAVLIILVAPFGALVGTSVALLTEAGRAGSFNPGAHGFSEILYAFTSAANNNGSAMAGIGAATPFYNTLLGIAMLMGRFWVMVPLLALAGSLARKTATPPSSGTLPTHSVMFVLLLSSMIIMDCLLTYAPPLALGPIAEHYNREAEAIGAGAPDLGGAP